jgi:2,3-bisphosphoglycerate-dependent phosphoglycerate mutase
MMSLQAIRHARVSSDWTGRFLGQLDVPLCETAIEDISKLSAEFQVPPQTRIFSSPLIRAHDTAERLFPLHTITIAPALLERGLGEWEGQCKRDLREVHPEAFLPNGRLDPYFTPRGGESLAAMKMRLDEFIADLLQVNTPAVLVTHHGTLRLLLHLLDGLDLISAFELSMTYLQRTDFFLHEVTSTQ